MENASNIGNLFAFSNDPVIVSEEGVIKYMNPSALTLFGWNFMYKPLQSLIPDQIMDVDSDSYVASAFINGNIMTVTCSTIDHCKLYCFTQPSAQADETIIHSVSSAMRELTSGIKTNADLLKSYSLQTKDITLQKYAAVLNHYTAKLKRLVNNYTLCANIKEKKQPFNPTMCSVNQILGELSKELSEITIPRNIVVKFHPGDDIFTAVDEELLSQLLINLISNSLNHMPNGGNIDLRVRLIGNYVVFLVEDNGTGIPENVMKDVFKAYTMPMNLGAGSFGTGLGMSVADAVAKIHGGSMIVESKPGNGTRISIKIPRLIDPKFNSPKPKYEIPMRTSLLTDLSTWLTWEDYLTEI